MKVIISAGGTGGHIYPALAIIDILKKYEKNLEILYIGTHNRMENKIVPEHNIAYQPIKIFGFSKTMIGRDIMNIGYIISAYNKCVNIMKTFSPDVVIGVGGYVTLPVIMAAKKLNISTIIHEQNCIPGKTNKFLSKGVTKVFVSFKESIKYFDKAKTIYTGNPSGDNIHNLKNITRESLGFNNTKKLVFITSGSLGSPSLNDKLIEYLNLHHEYQILMVSGNNNYDDIIKKINNKQVKILPYLKDQAGILKNVDLVISRAGATTISELIAANIPSILIPSPSVANNHQYYNAVELHNNNCAQMIEEKDLSVEVLNKEIDKLLNNKEVYNKMKDNLKKYKINSSAEIIYKEIKRLV